MSSNLISSSDFRLLIFLQESPLLHLSHFLGFVSDSLMVGTLLVSSRLSVLSCTFTVVANLQCTSEYGGYAYTPSAI